MRSILQFGAAGVAAVVAATVWGAGESAAPSGSLVSGVDLRYVDSAVRPQDDAYRHLNGKWLDTFELPADKGVYDSFAAVGDRTQEQLRGIVERLAKRAPGGTPAPDETKLADLYASFMNEPLLETLGFKPLESTFAAIDALDDKRGIAALIARANRAGSGAPYEIAVRPDPRDSTRYAVSVQQSGLGMPDRDYYLSDDAKLKSVRARYLAHVEAMLQLAGEDDAQRSAADILGLETELAKLQWTRVQNRDPIKTYNKIAVAELSALVPGFDWQRYLADSGIAGKTDYLIVRQPSYLRGLGALIETTPLPVSHEYFKWQPLASAAP